MLPKLLEGVKSASCCVLSILLLFCFVSITPASAQGGTATISGTVTDPSGAVIPNAKVEIKNVDTGNTQAAKVNAQGRYTVQQLPINQYEVRVTAEGFGPSIRSGVTVTVGGTATIDVTMQIGQTEQTISVQGQVNQVETNSTAIANLVEPTQMRDLPLNGRNFEQLLTLAPGVVQRPGGSGIYSSSPNYSVSGSRAEGQAFLVDNTDVQNFWMHGTGAGSLGTSLGIDSIGEFQVMTNTYSAQYGGAGAAVNATTKSGTNSFHGSLYEFFRNSALDAENYFDALAPKRPAFRRNQYGVTLGGPIKKDKAFFFANYESLHQVFGQSYIANVPDLAGHQGYTVTTTTVGGVPTVSYTPTPGIVGCPAYSPSLPINTCVAPSVQATLALYPMGTEILNPTTGLPTGTASLTEAGNQKGAENYGVARLDYTFSDKDSFVLRYGADQAGLTSFAASGIPLWPELDNSFNHYVTLQEKRLLTTSLINLAQFTYVRTLETQAIQPTEAAMQYFSTAPRNGTVAVTGYAGLGSSATTPAQEIQNRFAGEDDVVWNHGNHNVTFGLSVERIQDNSYSEQNIGGTWSFNSLPQFLGGTAFSLVAPVTGQTNAVRDLRELVWGAYVNDSWKATTKLTLNAGIRWSPTENPVEAHNNLFGMVLTPLGLDGTINSNVAFVNVPKAFAKNPSLTNVDPRIGFAYDPFSDHKTSIRGGFGIFHDLIEARAILPGYWLSPPFELARLSNEPYGINPTGLTAAAITQVQGIAYQSKSSPYVMQFNLNIQRQLTPDTILTVGYIGSQSRHLFIMADLNPATNTGTQANPIFGHGTPCTVGGITPSTSALPAGCSDQATPNPSLQTGTAIAGNPFSNITVQDVRFPGGTSNYNSAQVSVNHRLAHNFQTQISYTYSKSLDFGSESYALEDTGASPQEAQNPYNPRGDYGRSTFDVTQNFSTSAVYQIPFKANKLVQGWQVSGIFSATSGAPFTVNSGFDRAGLVDTERPNQTPGCNTYKGGTGPSIQTKSWYNASCFTLPDIGHIGNSQRDSIIGPRFTDMDLSIDKNTLIPAISERFAIQFRAEFFDVLNHPNFSLPNEAVFALGSSGTSKPGLVSATAGQITTTRGNEIVGGAQRVAQFALKVIF